MDSSIGIRTKNEYTENRPKRGITDALQDMIVLVMLLAGVCGQLLKWTQISGMRNIHMWWVLLVAVLATVILTYVTGKRMAGYLSGPVIALIAVLVHGAGSVYYGFFGIINYMISWWNVSREDAVKLVMEEQITQEDVRVCVMVIGLIMIPVLWNIVIHRRVFVGILLILACVVPGLVVQSVSVAACGAFMAGWFGLLMMGKASAPGMRGVVWQTVVSAVCVCAAVMAGSGKMDAAVELKEEADIAVKHFRYGQDTLPEGDISKADGLLDGDDPVLEITTQQMKDIYLRGFVGSRYMDGRWTELADASYGGDRDGMMSWLGDRGFLVQDQYSQYDQIDTVDEDPGNAMTVKNVGANRKYIYAPYSADIPDGVKVAINEDTNYISSGLMGARSYSFVDWSGDRPGELLYADSWVNDPETEEQKQYVEAESVYSDFVYDSYLDVDSDMADLIEKVFSENAAAADPDTAGDIGDRSADGNTENAWESADTIYSVTEQIRNVLKSTTVYAESPDMPTDGADPIKWFLTGSGQGNSVLYASTAVMAFRCKGIPARYVEGYRVSGDRNMVKPDGRDIRDINAAYDNRPGEADPEKITLTNKNSHAWVEVYLDGVGWIPVDVTPGFYYDTYTLLQMVKKPQNINESAASNDSSNMSSQLDENSEQPSSGSRKDDEKTPVRISLDILAILILLAVLAFVVLEVRHFVRRMTAEKRYRRLTDDGKTRALCTFITSLMSVYGCDSRPGWNSAKADDFLVNELSASGTDKNPDGEPQDMPQFFEGEYDKISSIMEKYIYGQQELTAGEIRTLYVFAEKLYEARKTRKMKIRLKLRYGM